MKHAVTRSLYEYWTRLRGHRTAPGRHEVEPGEIRSILGDTFILEAADRNVYNFRLAGTRLCAAYCRELKGRNLLDFWSGKDRESVACLLAAIVEDGAAAVIGLNAQNERGQIMPVEMMLLPLQHDGPGHTRILGCFAPMDQPYWLGMLPVIRQPIQSLRLIWPDEKPSFLLRGDQAPASPSQEPPALRTGTGRTFGHAPGRPVGHLRVIDGGRRE
ncbi:PAS domain-containing protein [Oryzibacter oryziterrae]|uniref:PAS domain-containing protein n=1 Tax=Oryzibacter oryziterrae TaxID=2766474 RepID=UPI001F38F685|nr:PAS domain-containing protein [Oryzibacter oryziterrae]